VTGFGVVCSIANIDANLFRGDESFHHRPKDGQNAVKRSRKANALATRPGKPGRGVRLPFRRHAVAEPGRSVGVWACRRVGVHCAGNVQRSITRRKAMASDPYGNPRCMLQRDSGERGLLARSCRQLAGNTFAQRSRFPTKKSRQAGETERLAAHSAVAQGRLCAPQTNPRVALHPPVGKPSDSPSA
jgi:hypothetical protein